MRVLLISSSYVPVLGGLQTVTHALAVHLRGLGHEVRVVTNRYPRTLRASETIEGVPVWRWQFLTPRWDLLRHGRPDLFLASLYYAPSVRVGLGRLMRAFRPDVVNVHFPDAQIPFVFALRRHFAFRLVVSLHGHDVERFTGAETAEGSGRDSVGLRALLRQADAVTACSGHLLEQACRLEPSVAAKGTAIYNGIDPDRFRDRTPYRHVRPYILALGRLTRKKGFDLLLGALARTGRFAAGVDLILAGEGEERAALQTLAGDAGLGGRVHFHGKASPAEVVRLLNGCLFLAVPSRVEPFGIVALEGLAAGKPVLATRVGGMGQFLTEIASGAGHLQSEAARVRLVEPAVEELAEGLREQLFVTPPAEAGAGAGVSEEYSWGRVAERYLRVLAG